MKKYFLALVYTTGYATTLLAIYWAHMRFLNVNVVFYAALADAFFAAVVFAAISFLLNKIKVFSHFEKVLLIIVWLLGGYAFAISIPTVIDRSLSFYLLEKLDQRGGRIMLDSFNRVFTDEYLPEHRLVDVRLTEQLESGTIAISDDCVELTDKGRFFVVFSTHFRKHWLPKKRLLMGEYTDALTDPFRNSDDIVDYEC